jgi:hypothetical protein
MLGRLFAIIFLLSLYSLNMYATDLDQVLSGDDDLEDVLDKSEVKGKSPFIVDGEPDENVDNNKSNGEDFIFNHGVKEVSEVKDPKKEFKDFGYTLPGTFSTQENYIEIDKEKMAKGFRKVSTGGINLTFIKNDFNYQSTNDIINRTFSSGYKSVKGGSIYVRHDSYLFRTMLLHGHWSLGAGLGYNSGKGVFLDGTRSDATFKLWEAPVDLGFGLEIPIYSWFKLSGTGGASAMMLLQNRSDFEKGEKGKRKYQVSPGYFVNGQFKINLSGFSDDSAYELFTTSQITNMYLNLEARYQNYKDFQDPVAISGTAFGIGLTFEYL